MAVITRWSYKRGGRKAGFHCTSYPMHLQKTLVQSKVHQIKKKLYLFFLRPQLKTNLCFFIKKS